VAVGDSPIDAKIGKPLWAEPDFDDSKCETVDLKPKKGALDPLKGTRGYVPGWTAQGHPGYWGYTWYQIRVRVPATSGQGLALEGSEDIDDAYRYFSTENSRAALETLPEAHPALAASDSRATAYGLLAPEPAQGTNAVPIWTPSAPEQARLRCHASQQFRRRWKMPALLTRWSIEPNLLMAVCETFSAVAAWPISPSTRLSFGDSAKPALETLRAVPTTL
jgi:hypothetical protein